MLNYFVTFKQFTIHLMTRLSQCFSYSPLIHTELEENLTQLIQKVGTTNNFTVSNSIVVRIKYGIE